ncbi:hypothetical protein C8R44DRAFT_747599 [Mycena epipterygia]|nr:hypothetical protein C8R44DRAFT_747599 [Mycena epipterygia]
MCTVAPKYDKQKPANLTGARRKRSRHKDWKDVPVKVSKPVVARKKLNSNRQKERASDRRSALLDDQVVLYLYKLEADATHLSVAGHAWKSEIRFVSKPMGKWTVGSGELRRGGGRERHRRRPGTQPAQVNPSGRQRRNGIRMQLRPSEKKIRLEIGEPVAAGTCRPQVRVDESNGLGTNSDRTPVVTIPGVDALDTRVFLPMSIR